MWKSKRWAFTGAIVVTLVVGGPFVYINLIKGDGPAPLGVAVSPTAVTGPASAPDGTWRISQSSQAGYRVEEVLFGQRTEAVGRTGKITGRLAIAGTAVTSGSFTVDLASVTSDQSRRDDQFRGRIMETSRYPSATFTLTQPIELSAVPAVGAKFTAEAVGELTLKGVAKKATFAVTVVRTGLDACQVSGSIPVTFADYKIANPSIGPIQTEDNGMVEFLLVLAR